MNLLLFFGSFVAHMKWRDAIGELIFAEKMIGSVVIQSWKRGTYQKIMESICGRCAGICFSVKK